MIFKILLHTFFITTMIYSPVKLSADDEFEQKITDGSINWSTKTLLITGGGVSEINGSDLISSRLSAERSAVVNSVNRAKRSILAISFDGNSSVGEKVESKSRLRSVIDQFVKKNNPVSKRYYSDGSVEFVYSIPLSIVSERFFGSFCKEKKENEKRVSIDDGNSGKKQVLVINVGNNKFEPSFFPVIKTDDFQTIYDCSNTSFEENSAGNVHYISKNAKGLIKKMGFEGKELTLKAKSINKENQIILDEKSVEKIKTELSGDALKNGRVIILVP